MPVDGHQFLADAIGSAVDAEVASATAALQAERDQLVLDLADMTAQRDSVQAAYDDHMATVHPAPPPAPAGRFPGDPGPGKLLYGNNGEGHHSRSEMDATVYGGSGEKVSCIRVYNGGNIALSAGLRSDLIAYANEGRVPLFSTKNGSHSLADLVAGAADATWRDTARFLADEYPATAPIRYSPLYHEPEDNFTSAQAKADFRAAWRRAVSIHLDERPELADRVTWTAPWFMEWTYRSASGRDYRDWHPCWSGTEWLTDGPFTVGCADGSTWAGSWLHLDAIDLYNPVVGGFTSSSRNKTWATSIADFKARRVEAGQPPLCFSIGEYGFKSEPATLDDNGITLSQIVNDTVDVGAAVDGLVDACIWTNDSYEPVTANDPAGLKRSALQTLGARAEVLRAGELVV